LTDRLSAYFNLLAAWAIKPCKSPRMA